MLIDTEQDFNLESFFDNEKNRVLELFLIEQKKIYNRQKALDLKLKKLKEAESALIRNITHSFATPLSAILGFSELLTENCISRHCNNHERINMLKLITNNAKKISDDLRKITRIIENDNYFDINIESYYGLVEIITEISQRRKSAFGKKYELYGIENLRKTKFRMNPRYFEKAVTDFLNCFEIPGHDGENEPITTIYFKSFNGLAEICFVINYPAGSKQKFILKKYDELKHFRQLDRGAAGGIFAELIEINIIIEKHGGKFEIFYDNDNNKITGVFTMPTVENQSVNS